MDTKDQAIDDGSGMTKSQIERSDIVVRKSEKLATATYMVSDIIPDREPVKWKMRETCIELLSDITLSATASAAERLAYLRGVTKKIEKMASFLDVAWTTRILSEMNASILRDEFLALRELVDAEIRELLVGRIERAPVLPPMYRVRREEEASSTNREVVRTHTPVSHERPVTPRPAPTLPLRHTPVAPTPRPVVAPIVPTAPSATPVSAPSVAPTMLQQQVSSYHGQESDNRIGKEDRRKIIQALLKQRSKLTVKDIGKSIPGFSEKTIQRELVAMLAEGQVVKEGEKRWTTYSLA